ncbi:MAG: polysaccharide deacetylase family protein [Clostridia bacterium]|nr:polysaccharide deacetylase family protein [Clostridia bacterium]
MKRVYLFILAALLLAVTLVSMVSSCIAAEPAASTTGTERVTEEKTEEKTEKHPETIPEITEAPTQEMTEAPTEPAVETDAPTEPASTAAPQTEPPVTQKQEESTKKPEAHTVDVAPLDPDKKYVAITLDDGPHPTLTKKFTDKILEYNGKVTYFVVGDRIKGDMQEGIVYAHDHGMQVAIHCWTHDHYYNKEPKYYHEEVYNTANKLNELFGEWPTIMRPPGGSITESQLKESEFAVIIWSIDTEDWKHKKNTDENPKSKNIETIVNNCLYDSKGRFNVENGDIILMHEIYENSYDAFCIIVEELHKRGFEFVTVSELLQNPELGYKYYSANKRK